METKSLIAKVKTDALEMLIELSQRARDANREEVFQRSTDYHCDCSSRSNKVQDR